MDLYDSTGNHVGSIHGEGVDLIRLFGLILFVLVHVTIISLYGKYVDPNNKLTGVAHYVALYYFYAAIGIGLLGIGYYLASQAFLSLIPYPNLALILLVVISIALALGVILATRAIFRVTGLRQRHIWIAGLTLLYGPLIVIGLDYLVKWVFTK